MFSATLSLYAHCNTVTLCPVQHCHSMPSATLSLYVQCNTVTLRPVQHCHFITSWKWVHYFFDQVFCCIQMTWTRNQRVWLNNWCCVWTHKNKIVERDVDSDMTLAVTTVLCRQWHDTCCHSSSLWNPQTHAATGNFQCSTAVIKVYWVNWPTVSLWSIT